MSENLINYFAEKEDKSDSLYHRIYQRPNQDTDSLRSRIFKAENTIMYHSGMIESHDKRIEALESR